MTSTPPDPDRRAAGAGRARAAPRGADPDTLPGTGRVEVASPVTGEAVASAPRGPADVEQAIDRAHAAFLQWRTVPRRCAAGWSSAWASC